MTVIFKIQCPENMGAKLMLYVTKEIGLMHGPSSHRPLVGHI